MSRRTVALGRLFQLILGGLTMLASGLAGAAAAQPLSVYDALHRPPGISYLVLEAPHFSVIFEAGWEEEARRMAAILEAELPAVQRFIGSTRRMRMPVVLNGFNDRSNGYVTPFPFKQEIEGVGIKGGLLSSRFSSWLWAVAPHELVHAVQAEAGRGPGVGTFIRWFAPDVARSFNLNLPAGLNEGAAVYHESRVQPGAGRLNDPFFRMAFRAAMAAERPWSLAQLIERPALSRPFDRHYIGGAHLVAYLAEQDSARFFRRLMQVQDRLPVGGGIGLWVGVGQRPRRIARAFRDTTRAREARRLRELGPVTEPQRLATGPGRSHRRPRWLNDTTLVSYVSGYDVRPGFYRVHARTGALDLIAHHTITEDVSFSLSPDSSALFFARYVPDPLVSVRALADVFRIDLANGATRRLTHRGRVLTPAASRAAVWALRNDGVFNQWVRLGKDGVIMPLTDLPCVQFISLMPPPGSGPVAVLMNVHGSQGLFRATFDPEGRPAFELWLVFEDASIFDASWSADGRYLLLTADLDGVANVYAFDTERNQVVQLTKVAYGAREPVLSPDGLTLAYAQYRHERYDLVLLPFAPKEAETVPETRRANQRPQVDSARCAAPSVEQVEGSVRAYRSAAHLTPRMVYPILRKEDVKAGPGGTDLGLGLGVAVQGVDPLETWAYRAEAFVMDRRPWGQLVVATGHTPLRPFISLYDLPETILALRFDEAGAIADTVRVGREHRGAALGLQLPLRLSDDVFSTRVLVGLRAEADQERLFGPRGETLAPFVGRVRLTPSALLAYRLQANPRDLFPNTGTVASVTAAIDAWRGAGERRTALVGLLTHFASLSLRRHTSLRLQAGLLAQNRGSVFRLERFLPRGYEDVFLGRGRYARLGLEAVQPLWFIDDGLVLLPFYAKALFVYGFAETVRVVGGPSLDGPWTSAGAGIGLHCRLFYVVDLDLRIGASYRVEEGRWRATWR